MTTARLAKTLLLAALALAALGCGRGEPTLVLRTNPEDAEVSVDGYAHPGSSPHEIRFKAPRRYTLTVRSPGFRDVQMLVSLGRGEHREQTVELAPAPDEPIIATDPPIAVPPRPDPYPAEGTFTVRISSEPEGAEVSLRDPGSPVVRRAGRTPLTIDLPAFGATEVTLERPGYARHRRLVIPPVNGGEVQLDVALAKERSGLKAPPFDDPLSPIVDDGPIATGFGYLSVATTPWTAVYVDGAPVGNSPLSELRVSAGAHSVVMENRDLGVRRKKEITVRAGEHVRLNEQLK